jgi:hypothetical protein
VGRAVGVGRVVCFREQIVDADDPPLPLRFGLLRLFPRSAGEGIDRVALPPLSFLLLPPLGTQFRAPDLSLGFVDLAVEIEIEAAEQFLPGERWRRRGYRGIARALSR